MSLNSQKVIKQNSLITLSMHGEQTFLIFLIGINSASALVVYITHQYIGDAIGQSTILSPINLITILAANITIFLIYFVWHKFYFSSIKLAIINDNIFNNPYVVALFLLGLSLGWLGFLLFGYGKAESKSTLTLGFMFRLIPYDFLAVVLFTVRHRVSKSLRWCAYSYILLRLVMGWTGVIFGFGFIALMQQLNKSQGLLRYKLFSVLLVSIVFLLAPFLFSLKFYFRYGQLGLSYAFLLNSLIGRLTTFPTLAYMVENVKEYSLFCTHYVGNYQYLADFIVSFLPRALLGISGETYETSLVAYLTGHFNNGVLFYLTTPGKIIVLSQIDIASAVMYCLINIVSFIIIVTLLKRMIGSDARYLSILTASQFIRSGSLEEVGYTIYAVVIISVLWAATSTQRLSLHVAIRVPT